VARFVAVFGSDVVHFALFDVGRIAEDPGLNYGRTVSIDLNDGAYTVKTVSKGDKKI